MHSAALALKGRLHKCPFSAPILGLYAVNRSVLALKTGSWSNIHTLVLVYYFYFIIKSCEIFLLRGLCYTQFLLKV